MTVQEVIDELGRYEPSQIVMVAAKEGYVELKWVDGRTVGRNEVSMDVVVFDPFRSHDIWQPRLPQGPAL